MIRLFKHYIPWTLIVLSLIEIVIILLSVQFSAYVRFVLLGEGHSVALTGVSIIYLVVLLSCMISMGLYQRHLREGRRGMFFRICVAFLMTFGVMSVIFYVLPAFFLGRGIFGIAFLSAFFGIIVSRFIYLFVVNQEILKRRLLVIGAGEKASLINQLLRRRSDRLNFTIVGYIALKNEVSQVSPEEMVTDKGTFLELANRLNVDEIVLAMTDRRKSFPLDDLLDCKMSGIDVIDIQTFFERQAGRVILSLLHPSWFILSDGFSQSLARDFIKRSFDLITSFILLIFAFPIMLVAMAFIYHEDRGPIFYRQIRVGKDGRTIKLMKFRSMRVDAEKNGTAQFAKSNDERVTQVGKIMRKTRIDELPQLFNVIKGCMSFVGPRPERPEFVMQFEESIPYYGERHRTKPGITGWAQICYPYGASEIDTREKLQYDLYYAKNYSIFLDLTILFQTAEVILWGKGAR